MSKNKAWYDQMTKELKAVTRELRSFTWIKKMEDDYADELNRAFEEQILFGTYIFHVQ